MIKAVIFDWDGVISDSVSAQYSVTNKILRHFSKKKVPTLEEFKKSFTLDWRKFYRGKGLSEEELNLEPELFLKEMNILREEISITNKAIKHFQSLMPFNVKEEHEKISERIEKNKVKIEHQQKVEKLDELGMELEDIKSKLNKLSF